MSSHLRTVRRLKPPPVPRAPLLSRRGHNPQRRFYSEQQRGAFRGPLVGSEHPVWVWPLDNGPAAIPDRPDPRILPPAIVPNITRRVSRSLSARCMPPRKEKAPFSDGRLDAPAVCLLAGFLQHDEVVTALTALEANDS